MDEKTTLKSFKEVAENFLDYLRGWKSRSGKKALGYFCTNTPEELIHAAGCLPVRITSSPATISLAAKHLPSYSCSLVQSSLEAALRGELDFLDGTVFPHTCDSIQRLSDIWAENLRFSFHWDVVLPVKLHTESARTYLVEELKRFRKGLEEWMGDPIPDDRLVKSILLFNQMRSLLRELDRRRTVSPGKFPSGEVLSTTLCSAFMDKEEFNRMLEPLLAAPPEPEAPSSARLRLFITGSVCSHLQLFDLLDRPDTCIVGDDLCTGWRAYSADVSPHGDPVEALADRLIRRVPCPCKFNPTVDRARELLQRVESSKAQGVVFFLLKFCDPHAFEYPYLKEKLAEKKIPSLLLEIEPGSIPLGALETRLQAFIETFGG